MRAPDGEAGAGALFELRYADANFALYLPRDHSNGAPRLGFLLLNPVSPLQETLTTSEMWKKDGHFLFFPAKERAWESFSSHLYQELGSFGKRSLAWLDASDKLTSVVTHDGQKVTSPEDKPIAWRQMRVVLKDQPSITHDPSGGILIGSAFGSVEFQPKLGNAGSKAIHLAIRLTALPPGSPKRVLPGTVSFIVPHLSNGYLKDCLAGFHYFYPHVAGKPELEIIEYPLYLNLSDVEICVDPGDLFNPERSFVSVSEAFVACKLYTGELQYGMWPYIKIKPLNTPGSTPRSGFIFAEYLTRLDSAQGNQVCLTPNGRFLATCFDPTRPFRLLCGLTGTEVISSKGKECELTFHPGQPAFVPGFSTHGLTKASAPLLEPRCTTSWVSLKGLNGHSLSYSAQPHEHPLFRASKPEHKDLLFYYEEETARLTDTVKFPIVPYGIVQKIDSPWDLLERQVLSVVRRREILRAAADQPATLSQAAAAPFQALTSGGLLVEGLAQAEQSQWSTVTLASNRSVTVKIKDVKPEFQRALQAHDVFLVASRVIGLGTFESTAPPPAPKGAIPIGDWTFDLQPASLQAEFQGVLIFKFCEGKIKDLVTNPERWTDAANLNDPLYLQQLAQWLSDWISMPGPDLAAFRGLVNDPAWRGVLSLNPKLTNDHLPERLKGLSHGIHLERLYAHHCGFAAKVAAPDLTSVTSSLFGAVTYEDPDPLPPADFNYKLRSLTLSLENSQTRAITAAIDLRMARLFGEPVKSGDILSLSGAFEAHDGQAAYVFTPKTPHRLALNSLVLDWVEVHRVQLETLPAQKDRVRTRFTFRGDLAFRPVAPPNLPSFERLHFEGLGQELDFDTTGKTLPSYAFDAASLSLDASQSLVRPRSLASSFPLRLKGFLHKTGKLRPAELGYLPVLADGLDTSALRDEWFALLFDFDLGTAGALSPGTGLTASLLVAWSPPEPGPLAETRPRLSLGLGLPALAGGEAGFQIQNVLRFGIGDIRLTADGQGRYLLAFRDMALHFLIFKLPPGGSFDAFVFGNPGDVGGGVGWFAGYQSSSAQL